MCTEQQKEKLSFPLLCMRKTIWAHSFNFFRSYITITNYSFGLAFVGKHCSETSNWVIVLAQTHNTHRMHGASVYTSAVDVS